MEKSGWRFASAAMRQPRTRPRLCKRCVASARQKSCDSSLRHARCQRLLNILNLHDAALCLRVVWILYHSHVQIVLIFAECDVRRTITCGDFEDVQKLAVRRYLQNLAAKPLGNINVTLAIDLHAIRSKPPRVDLVSYKKT